MNTGNSDNQDNDRVDCFMNRDSIQDWGICKFVSHSTVSKINIKTVFHQFKYIMTNTPINKTITSKILGWVFVWVTTCSFRYLYILQCTLASTCKNKIITISVLLIITKKWFILMPSSFTSVMYYLLIFSNACDDICIYLICNLLWHLSDLALNLSQTSRRWFTTDE